MFFLGSDSSTEKKMTENKTGIEIIVKGKEISISSTHFFFIGNFSSTHSIWIYNDRDSKKKIHTKRIKS